MRNTQIAGNCKVTSAKQVLRQNLADFNRGELPFSKLKTSVAKLHELYDGLRPDWRDLFDYSKPGEKWKAPAYIKFANMPLVERAVQIAREYPPENFDTIVGIDRGGRPYAKLVKSVFDAAREKQGLPKINILFLNVHVGHYDTNNWKIDFKEGEENDKFQQNNLLSGKDYGNIIVIDDYRDIGETRVGVANGIEKLQGQGVKVNYSYDNYVYFMGQNSGGSNASVGYRTLDLYNDLFFKFNNCFLYNGKPPDYLPGYGAPRSTSAKELSIPLFVSIMPPTSRHVDSPLAGQWPNDLKKGTGGSPNTAKIMQMINTRIAAIAELAKAYF